MKITINVLGLAKVIIDIMVRYYQLSDLIVTNKKLLFNLKF